MTPDLSVVEDGAEASGTTRSSQGPDWFWVAVGFVIGLGLAIVFFTADSEVPVETEGTIAASGMSQPEEPDPGPTPTTASAPEGVGPEGVGELVEGFPDTLRAVTRMSGGNLGHLIWPVAGPPHMDDLPGFFTPSAEFDASGRMLALGAPVPDTNRMLLSVGTDLRVQPVASDVTGFAWHAHEAGSLAYSRIDDGEWQLWVVDTSRVPEQVMRREGVAETVVAWGDWGFAVQGHTQVTLLSGAGEIRETLEGRLLDADADGRLALFDGGLTLTDVAGTDRSALEVDFSLLGEVESAAFSPDGSRLAVLGAAGQAILSIDGEGEIIYTPVPAGYPFLEWSSNSRFLISRWVRGILIVDTERSGRSTAELTPHIIVAVAAVPLDEG